MKLIDLNQRKIASLSSSVIALLPIGAVEVHGNHLPVGTDIFLAEKIAERVEGLMGDSECLILPSVSYGQVWSLEKASGSIHIQEEIFRDYIFHIGKGISQMGIQKMAVINAHMGNLNGIRSAARKLHDENVLKMYYFTYPESASLIPKVFESKYSYGEYFHACEIETSYMLYLCPDKVDMEEAVCQYPEFPEEIAYTPVKWTEFMDLAVLGNPRLATAQKGNVIIDATVKKIVDILLKETKI